MKLSSKNICRYLIDSNLISLKSVVEGDLLIRDVSSRNTNFLINQFAVGGQKLFAKQPDIEDEDYINDMKMEAEIYQFINDNESCSGLRPYMPKFMRYDDQNHILVMEQLVGVCRVFDYLFYDENPIDKEILKNIALILAKFHAIPIEKAKNLKATKHWFLDVLDKKSINRVKRDDKKAYQILKPLFENSEIINLMNQAKEIWQSKYFIHLDARITNFMMPYRYEIGQKTPLWIIDFELAGIGDAAWDLGFFLGELFYYDSYFKSYNITLKTHETSLMMPESAQYFTKIYFENIEPDPFLCQRIMIYTTVKVFLMIYEDLVDEPDATLNDNLKILIEMLSDMVKNQEKYQKIIFAE
jgi:thiamine kinase-like enzyme